MKTKLLLLIAVAITSAQNININVTPGEHWNHSFKMGLMTVHTTPQLAMWLADSSGVYLTTLKVTQKSAESRYKGARDSRPSSLPIWSFARGEMSERGNYMPSRKMPLSDVITSASPTADTTVQCQIPDSLVDQTLRIYVEVNSSMDYNEFYTDTEDETHPGFNGAVNGQPSILLEALYVPSESFEVEFTTIAHGEPAGRSGEMFTDLSNVTSALQLVSKITYQRVAQ